MDETTALPSIDIQPGELGPWDYSAKDAVELTEEEQNTITGLCELASQRDMAARRWEVEQAWEARLFDRGYQFLLPRKGGGWQLPGNSTAYGPYSQQVASMYETNIYTPYGQIITSALTRQIPKVRFEPQDPESDGDITAADRADDYRKVFSRDNDLKKLHTDWARYSWTDGRILLYTRHVKDAQRFGYEEEQAAVVPEDETPGADNGSNAGQVPAGDGGGTSVLAEQAQPPVQKIPRGQEVVEVFGKLEHKLPMNTNGLEGHFVQIAKEYDVATARAMFLMVADKITPSSGPGENELDRIARINCGLALAASYVTGDAMVKDVTVQRCWFRPAAFMEPTVKAEMRDKFLQLFPEGCLVVHAGKQFVYARPECMDDHLTVSYASAGDGQNRAGLGAWMISIQKRVNNWIDLMNDFFIRTVPSRYADSEAFNIDALRQQTNVPGNWVSFKRQPGVPFAELFGTDPTITHQPELPAFIERFTGELAQLCSAGYPALSGGDTQGNDTASGIAMQRDQALGRLANAWHYIQGATASYHRQAVMAAASCREGAIKQSIPGSDALIVEIADLRGNVLCFPEADTNFPEAWTERQARLTTLMQDAGKNPLLAKLLSSTKNLKLIKDGIGLQDLEIPENDSVDKQLGEFELLLKSGPMPNPQLVQAQEAAKELPAQGAPPEAMQQLQQAMQQIPPEVSTVKIDEQFDNHEVEYETCVEFINSPKGRKMAHGTPDEQESLQNIKMHAMEHFAVLQKNKNNAPAKPPSESINFKDLPPDGQVEMAQQAGIILNPQQLLAQKAAELASKSQPKQPVQ
jgi:hypothetical protein